MSEPGRENTGGARDGGGWWLLPDRLFDGTRWRNGRALHIEAGRITAIIPQGAIPSAQTVVRTPLLACPGFVDLQVNGGGGVMFNNDPSPEALAIIGEAHRRLGTTAWLPTFITDTADRLDMAVDAVIATMGRHGVAGMHIEGPHINVARKGTHSAELIRPFDARTMASARRLREAGVPTMLTLAPECVPDGVIGELRSMGIVVSAGHTAATGCETEAALDAGVNCFTHLHNAMTPMTSRDPGVVGGALDSDAWCGMIVDGFHVSDATTRISLRARKRPDRTFIVSDAMATVGGPDSFVLYGETIRVDGGRLVNRSGSLAGAHVDMARSVARLVQAIGLPLERALAMATSIPADAMGLGHGIGRLEVGGKADLLLLEHDLSVARVLGDGQAL
jgi:N-acetylglucosamine-6-phosphate deacetylase